MPNPNPGNDLSKSISLLEQKRDNDFQAMKHQLRATGESLKPGNLIKGALRDVANSSQLKSMLIKAGIGIVVGIIAKKILEKKKKTEPQEVVKESGRFVDQAIHYGVNMLAARRNALLKAAALYVANHLIQAFRERKMRRRQYKNGSAYQK